MPVLDRIAKEENAILNGQIVDLLSKGEEGGLEIRRLTTWIEYLTYEYNVYHGYMQYKLRERWYEDEWNKLRSTEKKRAEAAAESAQAAVMSAQQVVNDGSKPAGSARQRLATALSKLDSAKQSLESITKLNSLIESFKQTARKYHDDKREAMRHELLLRWIIEQIPVIEAEEKQNWTTGLSQVGRTEY
ncbi:hypothetical protein VTI74DRAFT_1907 [Chaetomium olivicolor]